MIPEELVQRGIFVDPYDLIDRYDRVAINGSFDEKMFRLFHPVFLPPGLVQMDYVITLTRLFIFFF